MRKEIKDHESSNMHSSNRSSVCKGIEFKKWKNYGLERWILYYKWREEFHWRVQWFQIAKICLVPVSACRILCLCFVVLPEGVQGALRDLGIRLTHSHCLLPCTQLIPALPRLPLHCWFQRNHLTARVLATSVTSHLSEIFNNVYAASFISKD